MITLLISGIFILWRGSGIIRGCWRWTSPPLLLPADNRDLNYSQYFSEGRKEVALNLDYNSHNTDRKDVDGMCELLLNLECVQMALQGEKVEV